MDKAYYVYLLTNWNNRVIYVGVTSNLERRIYEHKNKLHEGFTQKYNVNKLVFYESSSDVLAAIEREKQIKHWRREKKNQLVMQMNPNWDDLSLDWGMRSEEHTSELQSQPKVHLVCRLLLEIGRASCRERV